jgi:tRNA (cytidine32/uridine32-2'-O)-methyltransferase
MAELSALDRVRIVLVNTTHPGNIGATARAMKNMGLKQLVLVAPKRFPDYEATQRAVGAGDVLESAVVVETLDEALQDCSLIVGTSARERTIPWPLLNPRECASQIVDEPGQQSMAIVFGREDRGLTNDELRLCHYHVNIPTDEAYSSLNLAAAVQVLSYEVRMAWLQGQDEAAGSIREWDVSPASHDDMEHFYQHLEQVLARVGFLQLKNPRQTMTRLRRLYSRVRMDQMEVAMMRGMLKMIEKKLKA